MRTLHEAMQQELDIAVQHFATAEATDEILPHYCLWGAPGKEDFSTMIVTPFGNETEKMAAVKMVSIAAIAMGATHAVFVSEVWAVKRPADWRAENSAMPSECADREELLMVMGCTADGVETWNVPIARRDDNKRVLLMDEKMVFTPAQERMSVIPPRDFEITEDVREGARRVLAGMGMKIGE